MSGGTPSPVQGAPKPGRYPHTAFALVGAILGTLALIAVVVMVVVRPDASPLTVRADWHQAAQDLRTVRPEAVDPVLPGGWTANYARTGVAEDGSPTWEVGFLSPDFGFVALEQRFGADAAGGDLRIADRAATGSATIAGVAWTVYDHRRADDPGNFAYALAGEVGGSLVVLHGTGTDAEFATVAEAVVAGAGR